MGILGGGGDGGGFSVGGLGGKSGALGSGDVLGKELDKSNPYLQSDKKAKKVAEESAARAGSYAESQKPLIHDQNIADFKYKQEFKKGSENYLYNANKLVNKYTKQIDDLKNQAQSQANDAKATYSNDILPGFKDAMGKAKVNSDQAMTLAQAGNPNNPIMKAVRKLYEQQGQQARKQGQQDFGVLSALGAQAAGQQFGAGDPMTAGQMGQIYAANQSQAGDAYARAQQRMHDLQQQGIDKGFDQSNRMYEYGQDAQGRYSNTIKDLQGGEQNFLNQQAGFRDELGGYSGELFGVNSAMNSDRLNMQMMGAGLDRDSVLASTGREQNRLAGLYGAQQQIANNDLNAALSNNASKGQFISSFTGGMMGMMGNAAGGQKKRPATDDAYAGNQYNSTRFSNTA